MLKVLGCLLSTASEITLKKWSESQDNHLALRVNDANNAGPWVVAIVVLDIAMGLSYDINALPILLILQVAGIVLNCQDKQ